MAFFEFLSRRSVFREFLPFPAPVETELQRLHSSYFASDAAGPRLPLLLHAAQDGCDRVFVEFRAVPLSVGTALLLGRIA